MIKKMHNNDSEEYRDWTEVQPKESSRDGILRRDDSCDSTSSSTNTMDEAFKDEEDDSKYHSVVIDVSGYVSRVVLFMSLLKQLLTCNM